MATAANDGDQDGPDVPSVKRVTTDQRNKSQRLLRVDQIYSRKDRQLHFVKTAKAAVRPERFGKTVLVVRRIISKQGLPAGTEIDIRSPHLKQIFLEIFADIDGLELNKTPPMAHPELFFHARPHLIARMAKEKAKPSPAQALIDDLGTALRFIEEDYSGTLASLDSLLASGQITYDMLWTIFPPRTTILAPKHGLMHQMQAFNVASSTYSQRPNGSKYIGINGAFITHDGQDFGWSHLNLEIDAFDGARQVTSLGAFPLQYSPDSEAIRQKLVARGQKYLGLVDEPKCFEYAGERATATVGIREARLPGGQTRTEAFSAPGRIITDSAAFASHNRWSDLNEPYVNEKNFILTRDLDEDQKLVCAYWINGFSLPRKIWGQFMVESLADVVWNDNAFEKLVIKEERRKLIHGLVRAHRQDEEAFDDIVPNKGRGLVCLLAGSPGVGKTLTAEVVAETTRRPLYVVSIGELGINADDVDKRLETILEISRRWGCVLLIDEADVFLSVRGQDLARDTLVSIFLRQLEYFRGILILTTNRQAEIDPAFASRIHFRITYHDLDEASRATVWRNFLKTAAYAMEQESIGEEGISRLAQRALNGRQIKNAVSCATSLARDQGESLTVEGIELLLDVL